MERRSLTMQHCLASVFRSNEADNKFISDRRDDISPLTNLMKEAKGVRG
jgi:hypothetical protein